MIATVERGIESLFKKHKITRYAGHGRIIGPGKVRTRWLNPSHGL